MVKRKNLVAVLAASTCLVAGAAYAADQAMQPPAQSVAMKDAGKLSADGSKAYIDVALTRLAIFDGRINDAKKFVNEADTEFDKAKTDDSVFMKAEADLKTADQVKGSKATEASDQSKGDQAKADDSTNAKTAASSQTTAASGDSATTPKRWLPVDAAMTVDEDYTASPQKTAAVADANKKLAKGDKQGAIETLKLADVNLNYVMAVVPLDKTLTDVHTAATDVNQGKYYEASQELRQVQDATRYDVIDVNGVPTKTAPAKEAATH